MPPLESPLISPGNTGSPIPVASAPGIGALPASYQPPASEQSQFLRWPEESPSPSGTAVPPTNGYPGFSPAPPAAIPPPDATDRFSYVQRRFRELGSIYSLLETWGDQGQLYRFYCRMAIGGNSSYTRYFEATDPEPLAAMTRVLEQVEGWRNSGQP